MYHHERKHKETYEHTEGQGYDFLEEYGQENPKETWKAEVVGTPWFSIVVASIILTAFSVLNPLFSNLSTNLQSQNLYASWAMSQGQVAYTNFFGSGGLLFYGLLWLSSFVPMGLLLLAIQWFSLVVSGRLVYELAYRLTGHERLSRFVSLSLYFFIFSLGFGGLYAPIFAFPFLFHSFKRLAAYIVGGETIGFIRYGMVAALAFMVSPISAVVFYSVACLALLITNIRRHEIGLGIYQFLSSLVGFSLAFYPIGYIAVWNGSFGSAVGQVVFDLTNIHLWHSYTIQNLVVYLVLMLGLGFLTMIFSSFRKGNVSLKVMSLLGILVVLALAILNPDFGVYNLLPLLPFVMIFMIFWMGERMGLGLAEDSRRARHAGSPLSKYLSSSLYLPVLVMLFAVGHPLVERYILHGSEQGERVQVAEYISENSRSKDTVYAWDDTASLYTQSRRLSSSPILSPQLYLTNRENQISLLNGLQQSPKYIVVNNRLSVTKDVDKLLEDNYKQVKQQFEHFKVYQLK